MNIVGQGEAILQQKGAVTMGSIVYENLWKMLNSRNYQGPDHVS